MKYFFAAIEILLYATLFCIALYLIRGLKGHLLN